MNVKIILYNGSKYQPNTGKVAELEYKNIKSYEVNVDTITINLKNGEKATFYNNHVDMFKI